MAPQMQTKGTAGDQGWGWGGQSRSELPGKPAKDPSQGGGSDADPDPTALAGSWLLGIHNWPSEGASGG